MLSTNAAKLFSDAKHGRTEEVRTLLASDDMLSVIVDYHLDGKGRTALHLACSHNHPETAQLLLAAKASIGLVGGRCALHHACAYGSVSCARLLLEAGAAMDQGDADGSTALHDACTEGQLECARLLIVSGAGVDIADQLGVTPLAAASVGGFKECVQLLLGARAGPQGDHGNGMPLFGAVHRGHTECAALLLAEGSEVNHLDTRTGSALVEACRYGHGACTQLLLEAGADTQPRWQGESPLATALQHGRDDCAAILKRWGERGDGAQRAAAQQQQRSPSPPATEQLSSMPLFASASATSPQLQQQLEQLRAGRLEGGARSARLTELRPTLRPASRPASHPASQPPSCDPSPATTPAALRSAAGGRGSPLLPSHGHDSPPPSPGLPASLSLMPNDIRSVGTSGTASPDGSPCASPVLSRMAGMLRPSSAKKRAVRHDPRSPSVSAPAGGGAESPSSSSAGGGGGGATSLASLESKMTPSRPTRWRRTIPTVEATPSSPAGMWDARARLSSKPAAAAEADTSSQAARAAVSSSPVPERDVLEEEEAEAEEAPRTSSQVVAVEMRRVQGEEARLSALVEKQHQELQAVRAQGEACKDELGRLRVELTHNKGRLRHMESRLVEADKQLAERGKLTERATEKLLGANERVSLARGEAAALQKLDAEALDALEEETQAALHRIRARRDAVRAEEKVCAICMDRPKNTALVPCGHQLCSVCQPQLQESGGKQRCHMCQQPVERHVRLY